MISIVTITFNNFDELIKTINSVKNPSGMQHIVINGGSCEKTLKYLSEEFKGISLNEPDKGIADAFNKGLQLASGDSILFLNSGDILIDSNYLQIADNILINNPKIDFVHSNIVFEDSLIGKTIFKPTFRSLGKGMPFYHQTMIVRKSIFDEVGSFDLSYSIAMDFDFVVRMFKKKFNNSFYVNKEFILMDGYGISSTQEQNSIEQCKRSLIENQMFDLRNKLGFLERVCLYKIRILLIRLGLNKIVISLKKMKRSL
jgi:glycosyltransferase involved in cell wall biosynthesis